MEVVQEEEGKEGGSPFVGEHGHCFKEEPSGDATTNMQLLLPRASIEPEEQQQWWEEEEGKENPNEDLQHPARPMSLDARRCLWKLAVGLALTIGYAGYYVCRSNLAVASPSLLSDMDMSKATFGVVLTAGTAAYAVGKFLSGPVVDTIGGRQVFLGAMLCSIVFTVLFTLGSALWYFTIVWIGNRLVQGAGWPAVVKICSSWYPAKEFGTAMSFIALSYLFGDALGRAYLAGVLELMNDSWVATFLVSACTLSGIAIMCFFVIKASPADMGLPSEVHELQEQSVIEDEDQWEAMTNDRSVWVVKASSPSLTHILC